MALYDGFFDAVQDEETWDYDREYASGDFTGYFAQFIGSGVCILGNENSFKVRFESGAAVVSPGYLFIQGYWLKNDADYTVDISGTASHAIVAHLNTGKRTIEIEARSVSQSYPDALVLGIVNAQAGTAEDTRYNAEICGIIDSAGSLSNKVQYAVNYIDNVVETRLSAIEEQTQEQSDEINKAITSLQVEAERLSPLPVGTVRFTKAANSGSDWLRCNGGTFSSSQYPKLYAALGNTTLPDISDSAVPAYIKAR